MFSDKDLLKMAVEIVKEYARSDSKPYTNHSIESLLDAVFNKLKEINQPKCQS